MTQSLACHEWEEIPVRSDHAEQLLALATRSAARMGWPKNTILTRTQEGLKAGQVVGVLSMPGLSLEILPKIEGTNGEVRSALIRMLAVVWDLRILDSDLATLDTQRTDLLELLVHLFAERLHAASRRGLPRHYVSHDGDLNTLRGKLNINRQLTTLAARRDVLACQFDELSEDTPLNRVLKAAVQCLVSPGRSPANARRLTNLAAIFETVRDAPEPLNERVRLDRTNRTFHDLYELAKMFLRGTWQATTKGRSTGFALLFEMNELFEKFIGKCLKLTVAPPTPVHLQHSGPFALIDSDRRGVFKLRPDIVVDPDGAPIIIDTKWKRLQQNEPTLGVEQSDVYQMMAYGQAYGSSRTVLAYPWHADLDAPPGTHQRWAIRGADGTVEVATIDIGRPRTVVEQLRGILGSDLQQLARAAA